MKELLQKVVNGNHLSRTEAASVMQQIMEGSVTDAQIAGLLIALKLKREQPEELAGFAEAMRQNAVSIHIDDANAIDLCGTGGDGLGTFNISTVASFVVAGTGVTVAKHGNRSVSSSCGSADVLRELGVNIEASPAVIEDCINTIGIGFLFAPLFHPAMKFAARARTELGMKTCFNLLGPLTNPAGVQRQVVGTFSQESAQLMASVFHELGCKKVLVFHADDGLDEVSVQTTTRIFEVNGLPRPIDYGLSPSDFGILRTDSQSLPGGSVQENARIALSVLRGDNGIHRDAVVVNAALGVLVSGRVSSIKDGVAVVIESIDSGRAFQKLEALKHFTNQ